MGSNPVVATEANFSTLEAAPEESSRDPAAGKSPSELSAEATELPAQLASELSAELANRLTAEVPSELSAEPTELPAQLASELAPDLAGVATQVAVADGREEPDSGGQVGRPAIISVEAYATEIAASEVPASAEVAGEAAGGVETTSTVVVAPVKPSAVEVAAPVPVEAADVRVSAVDPDLAALVRLLVGPERAVLLVWKRATAGSRKLRAHHPGERQESQDGQPECEAPEHAMDGTEHERPHGW
jgi:hypothetical protein